MKTTIDLPDNLLVETKKAAAEQRTTIRAIIERALRRELGEPSSPSKIRWVTASGGLPTDFDVADRSEMAQRMFTRLTRRIGR